MDNAGRSREEMHAGPGGVELRGWKLDCVTYLGIYTIYFQTKWWVICFVRKWIILTYIPATKYWHKLSQCTSYKTPVCSGYKAWCLDIISARPWSRCCHDSSLLTSNRESLRLSVTCFLFYTQGLSLPGTWLDLDWRCQKARLLALSGVCVPLFLFKYLSSWVVCLLWLTRILSSFYHLQQEDVEGAGVTPEKNPIRQEYLQGDCLSQSRSRYATGIVWSLATM